MWILLLNDMRSSNIETLLPRARAATKEALMRLLESERVDPYRDGQWGKSYRVGGPLEWCNPPFEFEIESHFLDVDAWVAAERSRIEANMLSLLSLPEAP